MGLILQVPLPHRASGTELCRAVWSMILDRGAGSSLWPETSVWTQRGNRAGPITRGGCPTAPAFEYDFESPLSDEAHTIYTALKTLGMLEVMNPSHCML
jgi:hypothetical protein